MKRNSTIFIAAFCMAATVFMPIRATAGWGYDTTARKLTNDVWSINVREVTQGGLAGLATTGGKATGSGELDLTDCHSQTGYRVVRIGNGSLREITGLTRLVAPDATYVENDSIRGNQSLAEVIFSPDISYFGSCALYNSPALTNIFPTTFPHVKDGHDKANWRQLCTRVREPGADNPNALTSTDLARPDYPGRSTIGLIDANFNCAWVIDWPCNSLTMLVVR